MKFALKIALDIIKAIPGFLLLTTGLLAIAVMTINCGFVFSDMFKKILQ